MDFFGKQIARVKAEIEKIDCERETTSTLLDELKESEKRMRPIIGERMKIINKEKLENLALKGLTDIIRNGLDGLKGINEEADIQSFTAEKMATLDKYLEKNKNLSLILKNELDFFYTIVDNVKSLIFLNKILRHFFPELIPKSPQWLKRKAEEQAKDVFLAPEVSEHELYEIFGMYTWPDDKKKEVTEVINLLKLYKDQKGLENASLELVKSLKNYPELKTMYEKIISDLHAKALMEDKMSYETEILAKLKEFLQDKNIYPL